MVHLSTIDLTVCLLYLVVVFGIALRCARGQVNNEEYFVAGRNLNWWAVGISMFATSFSAISFLALPQRGAYQDFTFFLTILFIPLIITPILWLVFVPLYVRLNVSSAYEFLGKRFGPSIQRIGATLYCIYSIGWMGTMLYAVALTLQAVMGLSETQFFFSLIGIGLVATLYTAIGGLRAVVWTDVLQALILGGAILLVFIMAVGRIDGGWQEFWRIATDNKKFEMIHLSDNLLAKDNFTSADSAYTAIAFALFMYLPGYAVAQNMVQRYVCAGTLSAARGVVVLSAAVNVILGFLFLLLGTALFAFYSQEGGLGLPQAGEHLLREDQILPYFVSTQLGGNGITGLVLAGLFAAAMSTIDSGINGVSSVIVYDWLPGRDVPVSFSRYLTAGLGIIVIAVALIVPRIDDSVIDITMTIAGTSLGLLLALFLLGIFSIRANLPGVLFGLAAGIGALAVVIAFTEVPKWWYGAFTVLPTIIIGELSSRLFEQPSAAALKGTIYRSSG